MPNCSQPKCPIAETGVCLEGHKTNCPHLLSDSAVVQPQQNASPTTPAQSPLDVRRFHTGEKLTTYEVSLLLNQRLARVILCAGSRDSGKTTFLARIGEMFRDGSFANYTFAGSQTLCGFERATWFATVPSGSSRPRTKRTRRIENDSFLHLSVCPSENPGCKYDILISDLAGETFPTAVASAEFCDELCSLRRADYIVLFLDCARLISPTERHAEVDNARTFLKRVMELKRRSQFLRVQVIFSRSDYVTNHANKANQEKYCKSIEADFTKRFGSAFTSLDFRYIASRPDTGAPTNAEIQSIFAFWLEAPLFPSMAPAIRTRQTVRDFSAFGIL